MNLTETLFLDGVEPALVFELMTSETFQRDKAARLATIEFSMDTYDTDDHVVVTTHRKLPTSGLPEFVKSMVSPTMIVHETERWEPAQRDGSYRGSFDLEISGAPVELEGIIYIVPSAGGSQVTFAGTVHAKVPLFKNRVAEASSISIRETIHEEFKLLQEQTDQVHQSTH